MRRWIQTYTGRQFFLDAPRVEDVDIRDIAHALSRLCRFTGHVTSFYSVAQHCVEVSHACYRRDALVGLLHDATEAYLGDVSSPLKALLPEYRVLERRLWRVIAKRFSLPVQLSLSVEHADRVLLSTERRDFLGPEPSSWGRWPEPLKLRLPFWHADFAEGVFLERFEELGGA